MPRTADNGRRRWAFRTDSNELERIPMLVLSRNYGEKIVLDFSDYGIEEPVTVCVVGIRTDKVRLGVEAPKNVSVDRHEVYEAKRKAAAPGLWRVQAVTLNGNSLTHWCLLEAEANERAEKLVKAGAVVEPIKYWPKHAIEAVKADDSAESEAGT